MELNRVHQGDCLKVLGRLPEGSVDLVFADPPFNIGYDYDVYDDRRSCRDYLDWSKQWMAAVHRVLSETGTFWLAIGDEYAAELKLLAQNELNFSCRSWVIWYYTFGVNCVRGFSRSHTHLFHFVKDPNRFTFNAANPAVRVPSARQLVYADARANPKGRLPDNTWIYRPQDAPPTAFVPGHDTWYFARVAGTFNEREGFHGCQMPEQLLGRIIRTCSNPSDLVLDPFTGSGTTLVVAKKLGRRFVGSELSEEYVERICERLKKTAVGAELDGPEDPLLSAPKTSQGKRRARIRKGRLVPPLDQETELRIVEAFEDAADGFSVDQLLCDPELNHAFAKACKRRGVRGDNAIWNRLLLRIRKAGKLARGKSTQFRRSFEQMDAYSHAAEVATQLLSIDHQLELDELLCWPNSAAELDRLAAEFAPGFKPFDYRWAALSLRKRAITAKRSARAVAAEWLEKRLPGTAPLAKAVEARNGDGPRCGVYVLQAGDDVLYVGESVDLDARLRQVQEMQAWLDYQIDRVRVIPMPGASRHGLQSLLIHRLEPLLNSRLLRPDLKPVKAEAPVKAKAVAGGV